MLVSEDLQVAKHLDFCFFTLRHDTLYVKCSSPRPPLTRVLIIISNNKVNCFHVRRSHGGQRRYTGTHHFPPLAGTTCAGAQEGSGSTSGSGVRDALEKGPAE